MIRKYNSDETQTHKRVYCSSRSYRMQKDNSITRLQTIRRRKVHLLTQTNLLIKKVFMF